MAAGFTVWNNTQQNPYKTTDLALKLSKSTTKGAYGAEVHGAVGYEARIGRRPAREPKDLTAGKYCADRCSQPRVRKDYARMTAKERTLYQEALTMMYKSKVWYQFVRVHENGVNDPFAHGTSGFLPWHRKFLVEFENALRCLDPKFACVTLAYWDWGEWQAFCNDQPGGCSSYDDIPANMRKDNPNAVSILADFGGVGAQPNASDPHKTFGSTGHPQGVGCVETGPFAGWVDQESLCLTRGQNWTMPSPANGPLADSMSLLKHVVSNEGYGLHKGYRASLQGMPHNNAHNFLGGHMRSMRSPMDPLFWSHHAFLDKNWALWQDCHNYEMKNKTALNDTQYEALHRRGLPDDGMDKPMPFKITTEPFKAGDQCSGHKVNETHACRLCLGSLTGGGHKCSTETPCWCEQRWHPQCVNLCANRKCMAVCGTGGQARELKRKADFGRKDDQQWVGGDKLGYEFDRDELGDTPRDWAVAPNQLKTPYLYEISKLDSSVANAACDLTWESKLLMEEQEETPAPKSHWANRAWTGGFSYTSKGNTPAEAFTMAYKKAEMRLKRMGVDVQSPEGRKAVAKEALESTGKMQCQGRNKGPACQMADGTTSPQCNFKCTGDLMKQPDVCGFNAAWGFLEEDAKDAMEDYCQDVNAYRAAFAAHVAKMGQSRRNKRFGR
jgi:tyrosinase